MTTNKDQLLKSFGRRVREIRNMRDLTQEEVAERAEIHHTTLSAVEQGHANPTLKFIAKLAAALQVDTSALLQSTAHHSPAVDRLLACIATSNEETIGLISDLAATVCTYHKKKS